MHYKLTARPACRVRCGRILPSSSCLLEELVQLIKILVSSGRLRGLGSNVCGFGFVGERVTLSIRRRYIGLLFFFFLQAYCFSFSFFSFSFFSVSFSDVKPDTDTETEENDGTYNPADDCCDRCGRSGDIRFNLGPRISRK